MGRVVPCQPGLGREGVTTLARERRHSGGPVSSRPIPGCLARARATARGPPCGCHPGRVEPTISRECAHRVPLLTAARATTQKKSLHASERDTPRVRRMRARWRQRRRHWDPRRLVFVDETGVNLALTRTHGRAARGARGRCRAAELWPEPDGAGGAGPSRPPGDPADGRSHGWRGVPPLYPARACTYVAAW